MIQRCSQRTGFSLIELLVVVGTIALLAAILVPSLVQARRVAQAAQCLSNLRQFVIAAHTYAHSSSNRWPIAYYKVGRWPNITTCNWDFKTTKNGSTVTKVQPGHLWFGKANSEIQQCPVFRGKSNSIQDPYTGYNYNTSYVGRGSLEFIKTPVQLTDVRRPAECALFGDGEYSDGANKFMRSPWRSESEVSGRGREAGTQGYRHLGKTNVSFADGHAVAWALCYTNTYGYLIPDIAPGTGFLSPDNHLYDLK